LSPNGVISSIEHDSPSEIAGLKKDYRIVEVNGIDVSNMSNREIARLIRENEANLTLGIVKSDDGSSTPRSHSVQVTTSRPNIQYDPNITLVQKAPSTSNLSLSSPRPEVQLSG
jgi:C-terminal processing protease CtpA/Prc